VQFDRKQTFKVDINNKKLIRSYIELFSKNNLPFNIIHSKNMRNIIIPICQGYKKKFGSSFTLNSTNCKNALHTVANNIKK